MVTCMSSSHKLRVRFPAPHPVFIVPFIISLFIFSAGAVVVEENKTYSFNDFPFFYNTGSIDRFGTVFHYPSDQVTVAGRTTRTAFIIARNDVTPSFSGSSTSLNVNLSSVDYFDPSFHFVHVGFSARRLDSIGLTFNTPSVSVFIAREGSTNAYRPFRFSPSYTNNIPNLGTFSDSYGTVYASDYQVYQDIVHFDYWIALASDCYLAGFGFGFAPVSSDSNDLGPVIPVDIVPTFEVSSSKILPDLSSGGSVDLSGITSQINTLSAQMSASFEQVNNNLDSAEASISSAISDQTVVLSGAIDQAADNVNQHFDDWDDQLSGAFSSSDAQSIVETDQAVSELHQIEQDQLDNTGQALDDSGISNYQFPSEMTSGLSQIGTVMGLLFDSLDFVTPLIIFSCTFGLAFVLIGRKSKDSS